MKKETKKALKPCPFCGSTEVELDTVDQGHYREGSAFWAQCRECGASSKATLSATFAAKAWNRRACACGTSAEKRPDSVTA